MRRKIEIAAREGWRREEKVEEKIASCAVISDSGGERRLGESQLGFLVAGATLTTLAMNLALSLRLHSQ